MNTWSYTSECIVSGRVTKFFLSSGTDVLTYDQALHLLGEDASFREFLTELLAQSKYTAFRWETPPLTTSRVNRPFEFVLVNNPYLDMDPEPEVFSPYFSGVEASVQVLPILNLGKTATMIVPRQIVEARAYTHVAAFVRKAPSAQIHALWECVAATVRKELSKKPLWLSTAGGGVAWLHVRIEAIPKYYSYRLYANDA